jgi:hypothetical protein
MQSVKVVGVSVKWKPGRPLALMGLTLAGAAGGAVLLLWDSRSTQVSKDFIDTPEASVWVLANAALTAYWALIVGPLWLTWLSVRGHVRGMWAWLGIVVASALFLFLILLPVIARLVSEQGDFPLAHAQLKSAILTLLGAAVALPGVMSIWLLDAAAEKRPESGGDALDRLKELLLLRRQLLSLASRLAGTIALATLASGALRNALKDGPASFPNYLVFVYGAYFTALFALLYVPVYANLQDGGPGSHRPHVSNPASRLGGLPEASGGTRGHGEHASTPRRHRRQPEDCWDRSRPADHESCDRARGSHGWLTFSSAPGPRRATSSRVSPRYPSEANRSSISARMFSVGDTRVATSVGPPS